MKLFIEKLVGYKMLKISLTQFNSKKFHLTLKKKKKVSWDTNDAKGIIYKIAK